MLGLTILRYGQSFRKEIKELLLRRRRFLLFRKSGDNNFRFGTMDTKPKVLLTRPDIPKEAVELLREKCDVEISTLPHPIPRADLLKAIKGKNGLFCFISEKIDSELLDAAGPNLKVIATMSVGFDHVDVEECKKRNVMVGFTPDVLTAAVAELTIALTLATLRRLVEAIDDAKRANWSWSPMYMCGSQLKGSTVGIVGLGRIGWAIAKRLKGFEVGSILYTARNSKNEAETFGAKYVELDTLLKESDIVIACCALTPETKGLFNGNAFGKMKPTAYFINSSRGGLVDQDALVEALTTRKIRCAGLDVTEPEPLPIDHPLLKLDNCVILPHIGSATTETRTQMALLTTSNLIAAFEGRALPARLC